MEKKLDVDQYESIMSNLDRVLKARLPSSLFKQRGIIMLFEKYLSLNTDFEKEEKEGKHDR